MILDLESSAAATLLVEEPESAVPAAHRDAAVVAGNQVVSRVLLETELRRFAVQVGVSQAAVTELLSGEQLRSLDALHVASALRWQADTVLTYDHRQAQAAQDAGIRVLAPGNAGSQ